MEFSIVMTIEFKSNKPNKTYQNHTKNIRQSKQKNSQFISTEAKLKDFKGEQNRTYRKKKAKKDQIYVRVILTISFMNNQFTPIEYKTYTHT
jgi:hypothetical protein